MPSPFSIQDRINEIMDSFQTAFPFPNFRYYIGQRNHSVNLTTNYIVFIPRSENVTNPHINSTVYDGYAYDFCLDRNVSISAEIHGKDLNTVNTIVYGLLAAIKVTNGPEINASIEWTSQTNDMGVTRQGELAEVRFEIKMPVPSLKSFLVTPQYFEVASIDFVDVLPDYDGYVINPDLEIPPYYAAGELIVIE